ncbi:MAG TPA: deoxyribonuclease IV [Thermoanaerobaculia bacterium]|nr:deoxyribonuclease IV [Thermoanaerobaculia bacterium]
MPPQLGAHVSIAGGLPLAIGRGVDLGCQALQIFVKNASQWRGRALDDSEAAAFREAHGASPIGPLVAHSSYLINLAASDADILARSRAALADELDRCDRLGVEGLVVHPGAHLGAGEEAGVERVAASLDAVLEALPRVGARVLLENTAGQGTVLGHRNAQLAAIRRASRFPERLGFCLDTCHAFAAGYAVHEPAGLDEWLEEVGEVLGWERVGALHLNDSKQPFDSRRDRHENVGRGAIGQETFARLLHDPRTAGKPMIVETPIGDDGEGHRRDLELLRSL